MRADRQGDLGAGAGGPAPPPLQAGVRRGSPERPRAWPAARRRQGMRRRGGDQPLRGRGVVGSVQVGWPASGRGGAEQPAAPGHPDAPDTPRPRGRHASPRDPRHDARAHARRPGGHDGGQGAPARRARGAEPGPRDDPAADRGAQAPRTMPRLHEPARHRGQGPRPDPLRTRGRRLRPHRTGRLRATPRQCAVVRGGPPRGTGLQMAGRAPDRGGRRSAVARRRDRQSRRRRPPGDPRGLRRARRASHLGAGDRTPRPDDLEAG